MLQAVCDRQYVSDGILQTVCSTEDHKHSERLITQLGISSRPLPSSWKMSIFWQMMSVAPTDLALRQDLSTGLFAHRLGHVRDTKLARGS